MSEKKTYTEIMQEKLAAERDERREQNTAAGEDNHVGQVLGWLFLGRLRWLFLVLLILLLSGALGYMAARFLVPEAYRMAALIIAGILSVFGVVRIVRSPFAARSIWLGLGAGALVFLIPAMFFV